MARFVCIRAEVEKWRAEVAMAGNDKIRILDIVVLQVAHYCISTPRDDVAILYITFHVSHGWAALH